MSSLTAAFNRHRLSRAERPALPWPITKGKGHVTRNIWNFIVKLLWTLVAGYLAVKVAAGVYYAIFEIVEPITEAWHELIPNKASRNDVRNVGEGFTGSLVVLYIVWNHWGINGILKRLPLFKQIDEFVTKIEKALGIPVAKDEREASKFSLALGIVLIPLYAVPGYFLGKWFVSVVHLQAATEQIHLAHEPSLWIKEKETITNGYPTKIMGVFSGFFFGRRPARGVFDDVQAMVVKRRRATGREFSRWSKLFLPAGYLARYTDVAKTLSVSAAGRRLSIKTKVTMYVFIVMTGALLVLGEYALLLPKHK